MGDVSFANAEGTHIAYRVTGGPTTPNLVVLSGALFPMEALAEDRVAARFTEGLASIGQLVVFDKRGVGLSDPLTDLDRSAQEQWVEDLVAVVHAAGVDRPALVSWDALGTARLAVSLYPDLFAKLVLINPSPSARLLMDPYVRALRTNEDPVTALERLGFPSRVDDEEFQAWLSGAGRTGASPSTAQRIWGHAVEYAGPYTPSDMAVPTLVLHSRDCMIGEQSVREVADGIAGSVVVQIPGVDTWPIAGDVDLFTAEIARFLTGSPSALAPERVTSAVLFTDLVRSTERAVDEGDTRWRELLDMHDEVALRCVDQLGGRVVKYTGDGVLALLPSADAAIRAVRSMRRGLSDSGMEIRAGIHVGDVDVRGNDVSGISVNVAARIMGLAVSGEVLVSETVRLATLGSGFNFSDERNVELKGVPEQWTIHAWAP